jgi:hypothetical protein
MPIFNAPFSTSVFMPPFWVTSETVSVQENNTTVTTLDAGYVTQYSIVGGVDASKFSIAGNTLSFTSAPDFEAPTDSGTNNIYDVTVRATNPAGFADRSIAVTVTNDISDDEAIIINGTTHYLTTSDYTVGTGADLQGVRTSSLITLTVPAAVTVRIDMWGGAGGGAYAYGGAGGYVRGRITLQPNTNYRLLVAGGGKEADGDAPDGGWGGGGGGGRAQSGGNAGSSYGAGGSSTYSSSLGVNRQGGGGGGCSGLFLGTGTGTPLLIAGGGGGAGGGNVGLDAYTGGYQFGGPNATVGGDQTGGGTANDPGASAGASGRGGGGGYAAGVGYSGGGGGGGYYGGGGGGVGVYGGAGSSYANTSYMSQLTLAAQQGDTRIPYTTGARNYLSPAGRNNGGDGGGGRISISLP